MPKSKDIKEKRDRYSKKQKEFARFLYISGDSLDAISKRLKIPVSTLCNYSSADKWVDDRYPEMSPDDLYQGCVTLAMEEILKAMRTEDGIERNDVLTRAHKLTIMMRSIADIAPLRKATMQGFMRDVIKRYAKHPNLDEILRISQEYHDALYSEETPATI